MKSIFSSLSFVICTTISFTGFAQAVSEQDSLSLVDFYNSTNGPRWYNQDNWLSGPVSEWYGITVTNGRVTEVSLANNNLNGILPSSLGNLQNLAFLYLDNNQLGGSIPVELGNLSKLNYLTLSYNNLSGSIPPELGNLPKLYELFFDNNRLSGSIPDELGNLANLAFLYLNNNQLTGNIPASLGNLTNLNVLWLNDNHIGGLIPEELANIVKLLELHLNNNQIRGNIPPTIGNLTKLRRLNLSNNNLGGTVTHEISKLKHLQSLFLDHNRITGNISEAISYLPLDSLNISYNNFTFDGMELITQTFPFAIYNNQAVIPVHQNDNSLSVSAGGTLSNNTYKWFIIGQSDSATITGDSIFFPSQNGQYFGVITNSVCNELTLYTDTIDYTFVLPVTITNLKAQQQGSNIKVDWSSLTEINMAAYQVQRSANANAFSSIGSINTKGNNTAQQNYSFMDLLPLKGNNYYRLKAIDKDGSIIYSEIVLVNISGDKTFTIIYPVPAKNILHIQTNGSAIFSLINQAGKILLTTNINVNGSMNVGGFAAGLYYLKNNSNGAVQKVVITK